VVGSEFDGYLRAGVASAHDQHSPFLDLRRVTVLLGMELDAALLELARERRDPGTVIGAGSHDHVLGEQPVVAANHLESIPDLGHPVDFDPGSDGELECAVIALQIVAADDHGSDVLITQGRQLSSR
jgi:hypothetical protein